ncbi:MAG: tRNA pseudouridine(38-40) synthase TruA [Sulfurimonas sp.]|jgi:tRNA pseudouridine38-40 synthase|nr:tRNA pseudouridine(38-40) synthase TruA [Sulfurimonas sp.]
MRVALKISYNGTHFLGSQTQKSSGNTVLGKFEHVLAKLGIEQKVQASGRTDKGVHATAQMCHIDLPDFWSDLGKLKRVLNEMLPPTIHIRSIFEVADDFHARYSAKKRLYRYIIKVGESNPFEESFITFVPSLDHKELREKIKLFEGEHDFAFFMKSGSDVKSSVRVVYRAFCYEYKGVIVLCFEANGFLRSQIRMMVGALLTRTSQEIVESLGCKKKYKIKPAPSNGLYLARISY